MHKKCTRSAQKVHKKCTKSAHKVHKKCTKSAQEVHKNCTKSARKVHKKCTRSAQKVYTPLILFLLCAASTMKWGCLLAQVFVLVFTLEAVQNKKGYARSDVIADNKAISNTRFFPLGPNKDVDRYLKVCDNVRATFTITLS